MKTSSWTRLIITALAGFAMAALAVPAMAQGDELTLRRDGSKAVPLVTDGSVTDGSAQSAAVLRRDGSQAAPFVADLERAPEATPGAFDWGDAGIGAGVGALVALTAVAGAMAALSRRRGPARAGSLSPSVR